MKKIRLNKGRFALVDDEDYERVNKFKWYAWRGRKNRNTFYAVRSERSGDKGRLIYMHRFILGIGKGLETDHINGDGLDNRRKNLRACTRAQNLRNQAKQNRKTSSQYKGVCWDKGCKNKTKKWIVHIKKDGKKYFLGRYEDEREAALAYDEGARKLHGQFARTNFQS